MKDYYNILGVDRNSSADEIKKSYRKLSNESITSTNKLLFQNNLANVLLIIMVVTMYCVILK